MKKIKNKKKLIEKNKKNYQNSRRKKKIKRN